MHVHGFFPYFYARPLDDDSAVSDPPSLPDNAQGVQLFDHRGSLEKALPRIKKKLEAAMCRQAGQQAGQHAGQQEYVRSVEVAHLTPFYGYHASSKPFVRVEMWCAGCQSLQEHRNPDKLRQAAALLFDPGCLYLESSMKIVKLQPHESHVGYIMRFFIDLGVFGLSPLFMRSSKLSHFEGTLNRGRAVPVRAAARRRRFFKAGLAALRLMLAALRDERRKLLLVES